MKDSLRKNIGLVFGLASAALILIGAAACWSTARFKGTVYWVNHTYEVINDLSRLQADVLAMQANVRGFVLTGDDAMLPAYEAGSARVDQDVARLRQLLSDNPQQTARLATLVPAVERARGIMHGRIVHRRAHGLDAAGEAPAFLEGQEVVENIRRAADQMEAEEHRLMDERFARMNRVGRLSVLAILLAALFSVTLLAIAARVLRREVARRARSEEMLRDREERLARDLNELRAAEEKITLLNDDLQRRAAMLEAANQELEAFSYSVSHDLRAPLRHIDGFTNLLGKQNDGKLDRQSARYLEVISRAARQMGTLIDDLLAFSRIGRQPLRVEAIDQTFLVRDVIAEARYEGPVTWEIGELPAVIGDPALLRLVWRNLLDNAVKYSGKSAAPRVSVSGHTDATRQEHVYAVRDNGVGFDMAYADKLFGVFQRLHAPTEFEGTGIGLANVRRIVGRHGGRTWAEAQVDAGATFSFSLPVTPPPAPTSG